MYAQVVLGLPVEGPFDYSVPVTFERNIKIGARVEVSFRNKKEIGFVVNLSEESVIPKVKPIAELLDEVPLLNDDLLVLSKQVARYYCASWGEVIEAVFPDALRKGKRIPFSPQVSASGAPNKIRETQKPLFINDPGNSLRWEKYGKAIEETLRNAQSVLFIVPDILSVLHAEKLIKEAFTVEVSTLYRESLTQLKDWIRIKEGRVSIVIATRSGVFAPLHNLGLIIIDEEQSHQYKQEQVPHYHARDVVLMRAKINNIPIVLGSSSPSLESFYAYRRKQYEYFFCPPAYYPAEIRMIDSANMYPAQKRKGLLTGYVQEAIFKVLNEKGKILLFLNRKGFATAAACKNCGFTLKCSRCNSNLVFHYKENTLTCHYCNFSIESPSVCPQCNSDYIKFSGFGTEKVESELFRIFPQAKIKLLKEEEPSDVSTFDIVVATQSIVKHKELRFDLICILSIDNELNRVDFRASERTFGLLVSLSCLTRKKMIIQTSLKNHHCFTSLIKKDIESFYLEELKERRQLGFPPFRHFCLLKLRGKKEIKVQECTSLLFSRLQENNKVASIRIISANPGSPVKLRGNFCWQILVSAKDPNELSVFLKSELKKIRHSGIILTVDMDPV